MKRRADAFSISVLVFMLFFSLDFGFFGPFSEIISLLSPFAAAAVAFLLVNINGEERIGVSEIFRPFRLGREGALITLLLSAPAIMLILTVSYLTSLLLTSLGAADIPIPNEPIALMLLNRALIPSLCEEVLFRLVPLVIIAPHSHRLAVVLSALLFAFAHCNFFQIPFALLAGLLFIMLDIAFDSILPSLILHFMNNAVSVIWLKIGLEPTSAIIFFVVLGALSVLSLVLIFLNRRRISELARYSLMRGERVGREYIFAPLIVIAVAAVTAVMNII